MHRVSLILLVFLAACAPQSGPLSSPQTGLQGQYSRQVVISEHPHHVLMGHVVEVTRGSETVRALVIGQRRDGVHRLRMAEAWSQGTALPFQPTHRRLDGCTHGHCRDNSLGMIFFTDQMFAHARANGIEARLIGRSDAIDIYAPPDLFQALRE